MKSENGSVISSYMMGIAVFTVGAFTEPLLMILGGMIVVSGAVAKFVESKRLKYQALEAEKVDAKLQEKVA